MDKIDVSVQPKLEIHIILDNYGTHKHPTVKKWFIGHPRYHVHFTPTGTSWLNQIERWFAEITRKRIRRGTFRSVRELVEAIRDYIRENNKHPRPFQWVASGDTILRKVKAQKKQQKRDQDQADDQPYCRRGPGLRGASGESR